MQIDFLVLDGAPQPLGEDVIPGASSPIHADLNLGGQQAVEILRAGKVTALVAVPDSEEALIESLPDDGFGFSRRNGEGELVGEIRCSSLLRLETKLEEVPTSMRLIMPRRLASSLIETYVSCAMLQPHSAG